MSTRVLSVMAPFTVVCCLYLSLLPAKTLAQAPTKPAGNGQAFRVQEPLSPALPYDVDIDALRQLSAAPNQKAPPFDIPGPNVSYAQRLFDVYAWKAFIALNWPARPDGQPEPTNSLADSQTPRVWESYVDAGEVYQDDGKAPAPFWDTVRESWDPKLRKLWVSGMALGKQNRDEPAPLDESLQAFTGPLVDQQGRWVRYQVVMNRVEFDYVVQNKLYNQEGQAAFTAKNKVAFPVNEGTSKYGAIELKFSWKQLSDQDDPARFFVRRSKFKQLDGTEGTADFGLVGMHFAARTVSSPTWIWATFEHVDNTSVNDMERDTRGRQLRPTFFNPDNPVKPVNIMPPKNAGPTANGDFTTWDEAKTTDPTQVIMVLPVPKATAALNSDVRAILAKLGSVFQYYELIGTQWPVEPNFPAFPNGVSAQANGMLLPSSPESILFKIPGKVVPVHLVNTTMETFFQNGNQQAGPLAEDDRLPPGETADPNIVFATESCAGCHFSAGACIGFKRNPAGKFLVEKRNGKNYRVPIYGKNASRGLTGNADYSWLLQLRAQQAPYTGTDVVPIESVLVKPPVNCPQK